jgi:RNA polymerase sigma factor (sigma-70 family)
VNCNPNLAAGPEVFSTTHWSVVLNAGLADSPKASDALAKLCQTYWYPLYAYVRRKGYDAPDAQDLTQEFFARLVARNFLGVADRSKGKFRSFLLGSFEHFLAREWTKAHAQKRGGGQAAFSLDAMDTEIRYRNEPRHDLTPDKLFERRWATTVLEQAMGQLQDEFVANDKADLFAKLQGVLSGEKADCPYGEIAASLGMSEGALKVTIHRLRHRFGELVRAQIAQTVATLEEVDEELRYLSTILRQ